MTTAMDFLKSERTRMIFAIAADVDMRAHTMEYIKGLGIDRAEEVYKAMLDSITTEEVKEAAKVIKEMTK